MRRPFRFRVHFGLGKDSAISLEITWPSGIVQRLDRPPVNRVPRVVAPAR